MLTFNLLILSLLCLFIFFAYYLYVYRIIA